MSGEELSVDLKNDIELAFNLFKNENNKINKLKLRTMLFSFIMYKSSSSDINQFIEEQTSEDQEFFTFEEVCRLVNYKLKNAKDKEADEIFSYMASGKNENYLTESEITKAFQGFEIDASEKEIKEMMKFIVGEEKEGSNEKIKVSKEQFKKFYTDNK